MVGRQPSRRSSLLARSIRFSMSRMPSKYSFSLWWSSRLTRGLRPADSRLHRVEDAAIEGPAGAVADEAIEGARRVDLLGRRLARRDPRQARAVDHRQPVFEPQLVGLDAEHEARDRGLVADGVGDDLIHRRAGPDHVGIEADRRAREQVHAAEVRAGRDERRLVVQPADEDHVLAVRQHRRQAGPELHRRAGALGPPVRRLDAVREEHDAEAQRRTRGGLARGASSGRRGAFLRQQRHRLEPGQRQGDADAAEEVTPGVVERRTAMAHGLFSAPEDVGDSGPCDGTSAGGMSAPRARLRNWRLVTTRVARSVKVASPPAFTISPIRRRSDGQRVAARARSRSSCATAWSAPCGPASAGSRAGRRRRR